MSQLFGAPAFAVPGGQIGGQAGNYLLAVDRSLALEKVFTEQFADLPIQQRQLGIDRSGSSTTSRIDQLLD